MTQTEKPSSELIMAFASPILRLKIPDSESLNATIEAEAKALKANNQGITRSNRQGWHSDTDLMKRKEPGLAKLVQHIGMAFNSATKAISQDFDPKKFQLVADGWININPKHGYNVPHKHQGFMWSGCYYVSVPDSPIEGDKSSGSIEFLSPFLVPRDYQKLNAMCYKEKIAIRPSPGDMLIFPSYLTHWVFPNESNQDRITIAFNGAYVEKK